ARREIHGAAHAGFADAAGGSLAAEPETIEELDGAMERFARRREGGFFRRFTEQAVDDPSGPGLVVIDLTAPLVRWDPPDSQAAAFGGVLYHDGDAATDVVLRYRLSDDWLLTSSAGDWRSLAERRRAGRSSALPLDARAVLYGRPLLEFLVGECV